MSAGAPTADPEPARPSAPETGAAPPAGGEPVLSPRLCALLLALITAGAALLRLYQLDSQPGGLYPDEAAEGVDAARLLHEPGYAPVFFPDDAGREALFGYIVSVGFRLFGTSVVTLRGTAAVLGVLTIPAVYLLVRRFGRGPALAAATWTAGSLWLICISRDGMRNVLVPLLGALALCSLIHWADRGTPRSARLAGAICCLATLYTYQPLKLIPLLIVLWMLRLRRHDRGTFTRLLHGLPGFATTFAILALPMLAAAVADPANYLGRSVAVTPAGDLGSADSIPAHLLRTLGMFAITGDPNARHDVGALPLLGWPLFLIAGLGAWRAWRHRDDAAHALILLSLPVFLLPPLIATEGSSPHFLRSLGLAAPLAACIGLGSAEVWDRASRVSLTVGRVAAVALAALMVVLGVAGGRAYLDRPVAQRYNAFSFDLEVLATVARAGPGTVVILDDYSALVIRFIDADSMPTILPPNTRLQRPGLYTRIVARNQSDIIRATDEATAQRAWVTAVDAEGAPVVWVVTP